MDLLKPRGDGTGRDQYFCFFFFKKKIDDTKKDKYLISFYWHHFLAAAPVLHFFFYLFCTSFNWSIARSFFCSIWYNKRIFCFHLTRDDAFRWTVRSQTLIVLRPVPFRWFAHFSFNLFLWLDCVPPCDYFPSFRSSLYLFVCSWPTVCPPLPQTGRKK